jgi:hypothetical protein
MRNYAVHLIKSGPDPKLSPQRMRYAASILGFGSDYFPRGFHYKGDALDLARQVCDKLESLHQKREDYLWCQIVNLRTGRPIHLLPSTRSSCRVCGNELEGKIHCPLCGAEHR